MKCIGLVENDMESTATDTITESPTMKIDARLFAIAAAASRHRQSKMKAKSRSRFLF